MPDQIQSAKRNPYKTAAALLATFTIGTEAADAINVAVQLKSARAKATGQRVGLFCYLSDDANGDSVVATAPSSGWAIGTDGLLHPVTANKAAVIVSESDGQFDVTITESGAKTCYLVIVMPDGSLAVSGAITFAA
jgi:hypothetical protein